MSTVDSKPGQIIYNGVVYSTPFADLLPPLTEREARDLREDIQQRGVIYPIVVSEKNEIIDGSNRLRIAVELGLTDISFDVKVELTLEEQRRMALDLNVHRRHLSRASKKRLIKQWLRDDPTLSNKAIATDLGVDDKTIASARKELETSSEIPKTEKRRGRDGRMRAAEKKHTVPDDESASGPTSEDAESSKQLRIWPDEVPIVDKPKNHRVERRSNSWSRVLKDPSHRLEASYKEARRLIKLKVADRSPQLIRQLANDLRKIVDELDRVAAESVAA